MHIIDKNGFPGDDQRSLWLQDAPLPQPLLSVVRLDQWDAYAAQSGAGASALWLSAGDDLTAVIALLDKLALIVIDFPQTRDGRGFTLARLLRERYHFSADLRAAGPLLPDQFALLLQCGFTSLIAPAGVPPQRWRDAAELLAQTQATPRTFLERLSRAHQE